MPPKKRTASSVPPKICTTSRGKALAKIPAQKAADKAAALAGYLEQTRLSATRQPMPPPQTLLPPTSVQTTEGQATPPTYERLFHATVNVHLTAEPVTQIVTDMAAKAVQRIADAGANIANTGIDIRATGDFGWVAIARQAIEEAEMKAKQAVLGLVGPVAEKAWVEKREVAEGEGEVGALVSREGPIGASAAGAVGGVGLDGVKNDEVEDEEAASDVDGEVDGDEDVDVSMGGTAAAAEDGEEVEDAATDASTNATAATDAAADADPEDDEDPNRLLCFCNQPGNGEVVYACESGPACKIEWYHESCLKRVLYKADFPKPDQEWKCPYCGEYGVKAKMAPPKKT